MGTFDLTGKVIRDVSWDTDGNLTIKFSDKSSACFTLEPKLRTTYFASEKDDCEKAQVTVRRLGERS